MSQPECGRLRCSTLARSLRPAGGLSRIHLGTVLKYRRIFIGAWARASKRPKAQTRLKYLKRPCRRFHSPKAPISARTPSVQTLIGETCDVDGALRDKVLVTRSTGLTAQRVTISKYMSSQMSQHATSDMLFLRREGKAPVFVNSGRIDMPPMQVILW